MKLSEIFSIYSKRGFHLFPLDPKSKKPLVKDNLNVATTELDQLNKWAARFSGCHWGLSLGKSGFFAVDVDPRNGGDEKWQQLLSKNPKLPSTLKANTKGGGLHFIFKRESTSIYRGNLDRHFGGKSGIDVKCNGYVKIWPSAGYSWERWQIPIAKCPRWLHEIVTKQVEDQTDNFDDAVLSYGYVERVVKELRECEMDYEEWRNALMAIHSVFPDQDGLTLAIELSKGASYKTGDEKLVKEKWSGFSNSKDSRITFKTLWWMTKEKTGKEIMPTAEEDMDAFENINERERKKLVEKKEWIKTDENFVSYNKPFIVDHFNQKGFAVFTDGGNSHYLQTSKGRYGVEVKMFTKSAIEAKTKPYEHRYFEELASGKIKTKCQSAWTVWEKSRRRKEFEKIVFQNPTKIGKDELNLFDGFHFKQIKGTPTHILTMIHSSLCNKDAERTTFLLNWLSHIVQKPFSRSSVTPVFISEKQGTGKGLLMDEIMAKILGRYYTTVTTARQFTDRFNVKLSGRLLTFVDEATWIKNHSEDSAMKRYIGSPTIDVEEKFGASYTVDNYSRYFIASNKLEAVPVETGNRRYVVLECDNRFANRRTFFDPIVKAIRETDEIQKFFHYLMNRDISNFHEHEIFQSTDGAHAKIATVGAIAAFWEDIFFYNPVTVWANTSTSSALNSATCYDQFLEFCSEAKVYQKEQTRKKFWAKSEKLLSLGMRKSIRSKGSVFKGFTITPQQAMVNFCNHIKIKQPKTFDELDFIESQ